MALAYKQSATKIVAVMKDTHGLFSSLTFVVPVAVWDPATGLIAALNGIRDALVVQLNLVSNALVWMVHVSVSQAEDTLELPITDCHVNEKANCICLIDGLDKNKVMYAIPAPVDGLFVGALPPDFNRVDRTDAALNTFFDQFQVTGGSFTISDGEKLSDTQYPVQDGKRHFRKTGAPGVA